MRKTILQSLFSSRYSHQVLLLMLVSVMLAGPLLEGFENVQWWMSLLFILVLMAAVRTMAESRLQLALVVFLAFAALLGHVGAALDMTPVVGFYRDLTTALFLFAVSLALLSDIIARSEAVSMDLIFGAVNVYLMIGLGFSFVYSFVEYMQPGSFNGFEKLVYGENTTEHFVYFSYVTLSTLGYGDITPKTNLTTTLAYIEAMIGQMYLAILVARLVGLHISGAKNRLD